jgi:hypothetical protein
MVLSRSSFMLLDRELLRSVDISSHPVLIVMAIAVTALLLAEIRFASVRVPVVVWEMVFGIVLGPQLLVLYAPIDCWAGECRPCSSIFHGGNGSGVAKDQGTAPFSCGSRLERFVSAGIHCRCCSACLAFWGNPTCALWHILPQTVSG